MIIFFSLKITREQKEALLSFYPRGIKQFIEKTISDTADRIIIEKDLFNVEEELRAYHNRKVLNGYDPKKRKVTQATKDKISKTLKEKYRGKHYPLFEETKIKIGLAHKGKIVSKETGEKISKAKKGKKFTEKHKKSMSLARIGMKYKKRVVRSS